MDTVPASFGTWVAQATSDPAWVADAVADDPDLEAELLDDPDGARRLLALHHAEVPNRRALFRLLERARQRPDGARWVLEQLTRSAPAARPDDQGPPPIDVLEDTLARHAPPARALTRPVREVAPT